MNDPNPGGSKTYGSRSGSGTPGESDVVLGDEAVFKLNRKDEEKIRRRRGRN